MTENTENITPIIVKLLGNEFTLTPDRKLKFREKIQIQETLLSIETDDLPYDEPDTFLPLKDARKMLNKAIEHLQEFYDINLTITDIKFVIDLDKPLEVPPIVPNCKHCVHRKNDLETLPCNRCFIESAFEPIDKNYVYDDEDE
jgi:hypothetical protein